MTDPRSPLPEVLHVLAAEVIVASRRNPHSAWRVRRLADGALQCRCPATRDDCAHVRAAQRALDDLHLLSPAVGRRCAYCARDLDGLFAIVALSAIFTMAYVALTLPRRGAVEHHALLLAVLRLAEECVLLAADVDDEDEADDEVAA